MFRSVSLLDSIFILFAADLSKAVDIGSSHFVHCVIVVYWFLVVAVCVNIHLCPLFCDALELGRAHGSVCVS